MIFRRRTAIAAALALVVLPHRLAAQASAPDSAHTSLAPVPQPHYKLRFAAGFVTSILAHETEEAISDPDLNAWYDRSGAENADKCAWTFGATHTAANGSLANIHLGTRDYLIQQNWVNTTNACAMSF